MWLGVVYNLREWINHKRSGRRTGADEVPASDSLPMETGQTQDGVPLDRVSTSNSSASSVFQTVGVRKRATQFLRRANRPTVCTAP